MSLLDSLFHWQPIETVPSDGTPALVRIGDKIFAVATFSTIARNSRFNAWAPLDAQAVWGDRPVASLGSQRNRIGSVGHRDDLGEPDQRDRGGAKSASGRETTRFDTSAKNRD